jgi:hypothetical protein
MISRQFSQISALSVISDQLSDVILNPLSIGYISRQAKGPHAKGRINNQSLITGFSVIPNPFLIV